MTDPEDASADEAASTPNWRVYPSLSDAITGSPLLQQAIGQSSSDRPSALTEMQTSEQALDLTATSGDDSPSRAHARIDEDEMPATRIALIQALPKRWLRLYMTALYETGNPPEAREIAGGVSKASVEKACMDYPEFGALHKEAMDARHERVDACLLKVSLEGDTIPVFQQGEEVGSYQKANPKAIETYYKRHGLLAADQVNVTHGGRVDTVTDAQIPEMLVSVAKLLFGQRQPVKTLKVVSESDKNG
jgi:hypothetical protein